MRKGSSTISFLTWVAGGAISLVATVALAFATSTSETVDKLYVSDTSQLQRISVIEAHYADIDSRLSRIENKLDNLKK